MKKFLILIAIVFVIQLVCAIIKDLSGLDTDFISGYVTGAIVMLHVVNLRFSE